MTLFEGWLPYAQNSRADALARDAGRDALVRSGEQGASRLLPQSAPVRKAGSAIEAMRGY
jgi:hypothetical protein